MPVDSAPEVGDGATQEVANHDTDRCHERELPAIKVEGTELRTSPRQRVDGPYADEDKWCS